MIKKALSVLLALIIMIPAGGIYAFAADNTSGKAVKTVASSTMMSEAKWASGAVINVKKGQTVKLLGKSGRWYKAEYKGKTGYLYNRAIKNKSNLSRKKVNKKNYTVYLDDVIFTNGRSIKGCYKYVTNNLTYSRAVTHKAINSVAKLEANEKKVTAEAIKKKRGNCVEFATLLKVLLQRAGYETYYAYSHNTKYSVNVHAWCVVNTGKGYRHIDAKRKFYLLTDAQLKTNPKSNDLQSIEGHYPPCK